MAEKRTEEFKREAVRIALTGGLPRGQVAADRGFDAEQVDQGAWGLGHGAAEGSGAGQGDRTPAPRAAPGDGGEGDAKKGRDRFPPLVRGQWSSAFFAGQKR
ncbi:MAG: hypothetical protein N838_28375 [Thiohalocapsa sp. PB-PSB1]|jgi:hypothetical protein|nr:MAG: hypothetical protein N838_28375 [Thiohalocapsa sp. PB-PSB1]